MDKEIMALQSFKENIEQLKDLIAKQVREEADICGRANQGEMTHDPKGQKVGIKGPVTLNRSSINAVGSVDLSPSAFKLRWARSPTIGSAGPVIRVVVQFRITYTYRDLWDLDWSWWNPKSWVTDMLPRMSAGAGTPFYVNGSFEYGDSVTFVHCCPNSIVVP